MSNENYQIAPYLMGVLKNHLNQLSNKYSKLLPIRLDFSYRSHSPRWHQRNNDYSTCDICKLMEYLISNGTIVGYAWVVEYTQQHGIHFHTVLYLNAQLQRSYYPIYQKAEEYWDFITLNQGNVHDCNRNKANYTVKGLKPLDYHNDKQRSNFNYAISYLAKQEQKEIFGDMRGVLGVSYVPEPSGRGRPRMQ
ncbi:inovirus-type Gp2 protein [Orbus sasakiae]|uniref:Inovirus-type Gp2 protein n=1 Tax=Orbus sasakiae TaxID=1078475 RepID=A0ABP9N6C0_9GAMM